MSLVGKVVLITGATSDLGSSVVRAFSASGARLALTGRRREVLEGIAREAGLPAEQMLVQTADLGKVEEAGALIGAVAARWGGVDVLVNLAGGWRGGERLADLSDAEFEITMQSNLLCAFHMCRAVLPYMVSRGWGRIVSISSRAAVSAGARQAAYNIAKAGVVALTESIAADYAREGVAANVILPSVIDSLDSRSAMPKGDPRRWVKPDEVAAMVLFLAGDEASALSGASIPMYGRM